VTKVLKAYWIVLSDKDAVETIVMNVKDERLMVII
jgi:hypothetical protein